MMDEPLIQVRSLGFAYGRTPVLHDLNLTLCGGTVVGVVGPNGAGKSTFARLLCGLRHPRGGTVTVGGRSAYSHRLVEGVGYQPEELPRPWRCTVRRLLALRAEAEAVDDMAMQLGLEWHLDRRLTVLSKGQWRLALIAYAALAGGVLSLFDEPDAGLDPDALDRFAAVARSIARAGKTVVVLSHQLAEIERLADVVIFFRDGRIVHRVATSDSGVSRLRDAYRLAMEGDR
jgi:ABC-type multidrug transport system ATPase subunit